jgi:integrase
MPETALTRPVDDAVTNLRSFAEAAHGAFSPNTERAIRADIAVFGAWSLAAGHCPMPARPETVGAFVDAMAAVKAPATVRRYVSSVSTFHRAAQAPNPCDDLIVKLALKRMHRAKGRAQKQAKPLNDELVRQLLRVPPMNRRHLRDKALLVVAYTTLMRRSELVAVQFADLTVEGDGFATITIGRSKTDQEGAGAVVPVPIDAMRHVQAWLDAAGIADGALFRAVMKGDRIGGPLIPGDVSRLFKRMCVRAGFKPKERIGISGHSTRIGSAQDMIRYGEQLPGIMQAGRWKSSEMVGRYTAKQGARHSAATRVAERRVQF